MTLVGTYLSDGAEVKKGFFYGYKYYVWFGLSLANVGGLYSTAVVRYTDMKGFSAAAATVLSTSASGLLFALQGTLTFALRAFLVCVSIYL